MVRVWCLCVCLINGLTVPTVAEDPMQDQKEWIRGQAEPKSRRKLCPGPTPRLLQILHPTLYPVYLLNNLLTLCLNPTGSYPPSVPPAPPSTLSFLHPGPVKRGGSSTQAEIMKNGKQRGRKTSAEGTKGGKTDDRSHKIQLSKSA